MKLLKTVLRMILTVVILGSGVYAFTLYQGYQTTQTPSEVCTKLHDFYISSGYTNKREYVKDLELLQDFKQTALDSLSYKDTVLISNGQETDNQWLNYIEETIKLNQEGQAKVEKPEYLQVVKATEEAKGTGFDFIKLLK